MDFLKIDLDQEGQPAIVRLRDDTINIVQAIFSDGGATFTCFGTDIETKRFILTTDTMEKLCGAWLEYQGRVMQHTVTIAERKEQAIAKAKALAKSVKFDYEPLNVQFTEYDGGWTISLPAIAFNRWSGLTEDLPNLVTDALTMLKDRVAYAEKHNWPATHNEWKAIVASYRRAFPLEPAEITEARKLLTEAGIENWTITQEEEPDCSNCWTFYGLFGDTGEICMSHETPTQLLADIKEYLERKQTDALLDQIEQEIFDEQEPIETGD